ncbi:MAG: sigma-70 family RNA polymerase sigma factor [Clostridia bacterium]|nr:sigma-70 family RNA polymerase sigma factor [Clostridia bacterium]
MSIDKTALASLVERFKQGDGQAFEEIYNHTREPAYFTALKISKSEDDAEDILQESYVYVLEKIKDLENPESFQSWFNQIVANKAKYLLRQKHPERFTDAYFKDDDGEEVSKFDLMEDDDENIIPESALENTELQKAVINMIDSLSDDKRTAVVLYYYDNMTTKQIAESLGVNENTVKSRLVQAKKDLAKSVTEYEKKHGKLLGVAPIPLVIWALKAAGAAAASSSVASGAAATTLQLSPQGLLLPALLPREQPRALPQARVSRLKLSQAWSLPQ